LSVEGHAQQGGISIRFVAGENGTLHPLEMALEMAPDWHHCPSRDRESHPAELWYRPVGFLRPYNLKGYKQTEEARRFVGYDEPVPSTTAVVLSRAERVTPPDADGHELARLGFNQRFRACPAYSA